MKVLVAFLAVGMAHQSFNGGVGFAPHWEEPTWTNGDDPTRQTFRGARTDHSHNYVGTQQDDNYMNKDDDRRVYAPAYDDHMSYSHHPVAAQFSDEHFQDDEGQSTRVIHGQDTSQHVNRRSKKKVFDTIKEPKHHFAVQTIDVPFPFHHHYYNHTKVHYHDGYDLYDDDVGDSEKYYHVNPDTHTNVNGWFADDHYRIGNEQFNDDGDAVDDYAMGFRNDNDGSPSGRGTSGSGLAITDDGYDSDDNVNTAPAALRYRWSSTDRLSEWRMRNRNYASGAGANGNLWKNTGTGTLNKAKGAAGSDRRGDKDNWSGNWQWVPFSKPQLSNGPYIQNNNGDVPDTWGSTKYKMGTSNKAMRGSDQPLVNAGTIGSIGSRTYSRGYYGENKQDTDAMSFQDPDNFRKTQGSGNAAGINALAKDGAATNANGAQVAYGGINAQVDADTGKSWIHKTFGQRTGTEGTYVGGALSNYKYNWDQTGLSSYPRGIRENTSGQDEDGADDDAANDNDDGFLGSMGSWNMSELAQTVADAVSNHMPWGSDHTSITAAITSALAGLGAR